MISNSSKTSSKNSGATSYELKSVPKGKSFYYKIKEEILKFNSKIQKIDEKNKKKECDLKQTNKFIYLLTSGGILRRRIHYKKIDSIVYSLMGNQFVLQIKSERSIRIVSVELRYEIIYKIQTIYCSELKIDNHLKIYFIDEINLGRFVTTKKMIKGGLSVNMKDEEFDNMNPGLFAAREASENSTVIDKKDKTVTIWSETKKSVEEVTLEDFTIQKLLGKGNFGKVMLAMRNKTEKMYAMKIQDKKSIIEQNQVNVISNNLA